MFLLRHKVFLVFFSFLFLGRAFYSLSLEVGRFFINSISHHVSSPMCPVCFKVELEAAFN